MGKCHIFEQLCGRGTRGVGFDDKEEKPGLLLPWWLSLETSFPALEKVLVRAHQRPPGHWAWKTVSEMESLGINGRVTAIIRKSFRKPFICLSGHYNKIPQTG